MQESFLYQKLEQRRLENSYRRLGLPAGNVDFCSNDYLGVVKNNLLLQHAECGGKSGSTGSRLLTGNSALTETVEGEIAGFHHAEAGLIYTSGYEANTGLLSAVALRGDTIIYDYLSHASIRDGIRLTLAEAFSFRHNDVNDLEKKLSLARGNIFVVVESVYSMDGDMAPLLKISDLCNQYQAHLVVDEAHATGIIGEKGEGLVQTLGLEGSCFARIHTFGKACGALGAIVLGSATLRSFLINFSRPFIYTTALPEVSIRAIREAYQLLPTLSKERQKLNALTDAFGKLKVPFDKTDSRTAIQGVIIPGNDRVKAMAGNLLERGLDARPILYPSVPKGAERLRIVLHSFNEAEELLMLERALSG